MRVVMTESGGKFVAAATLEVLSRHPVHSDMFARDEEFPVLHLGLAGWPDLVLVAPATANSIARMALGLADDLLAAVMLSTTAPVLVAPSMEEHMLDHAATQANIETLRRRGCAIIAPEEGELASGASGRGRLPEPEVIAERAVQELVCGRDLEGLKLLVTAGPTLEDIDPVRFIGNRSSGKMGYAVAQRARKRGAQVWLISGPTQLSVPVGVELLRVRSTLELQRQADALFAEMDGAIMAAAPADYRPREVATEKIKRSGSSLHIELVENPDVAAGLGARKREEQLLVLFALETEEGLDQAREKLARKKGDLVVLNSLRDAGAGFEVDSNVVTLIDTQGKVEKLSKMSKIEVADRILDWLGEQRRGLA